VKVIPLNEETEFLEERALTLTGALHKKFGGELKEVTGEKVLGSGMATYEYTAKVSGSGWAWGYDDLFALVDNAGFKPTTVGTRNDLLEFGFEDVRYAPIEWQQLIDERAREIRGIAKPQPKCGRGN